MSSAPTSIVASARDEALASRLEARRCIVLGGSGFLGSNLCASLRHKVAELRAFSTTPCRVEGVDWRQGDFLDSDQLRSALTGMETVYHLVGTNTPAGSNTDIAADARQNILSTIGLLDICRGSGVERVVFVSSGGTVYGEPQYLPIDEGHPTNPICAYGVSKLTIEKYLALYEQLYGLRALSLRLSNPYGPYQSGEKRQGAIAVFIAKALRGEAIEIWGDGSVVRDYLYVADAVEALERAAVYAGDNRVFNVGSGLGVALNDIVAALGKVLGKVVRQTHLPSRSFDVSANVLSSALAERELNWRAVTSLADGIRRTVDWCRARGERR